MKEGIVMERSNKPEGTIVCPTVEQLKGALKASGYKVFTTNGEEESSFVGFATLYGKRDLVAIFNSWAFCLNAMIIKNGRPVVTDCSVSGTVMYGNIQEMNNSLTYGGGIETVYYNDGRVEHFKAGEKKF